MHIKNLKINSKMTEQKFNHGANGTFQEVKGELEDIVRIADDCFGNPDNPLLRDKIYDAAQNLRKLQKTDKNAFTIMYYEFQRMQDQYSLIKFFDIANKRYGLSELFEN
jgi:glycogen synthase